MSMRVETQITSYIAQGPQPRSLGENLLVPVPESSVVTTEPHLSTIFGGEVPMEPVKLTDEQVKHVVYTADLIAQSKQQSPFSFFPARTTQRLVGAFQGDTDKAPKRIKKRLSKIKPPVTDELPTQEIEKRKKVLDAVRQTRSLGKKYRKLLTDTVDGVTFEDIRALKDTIPPWHETTKILTDNQRVAAEAASARMLLQEYREDAERKLPSLRQKDKQRTSDRDLITRHMAELFVAMMSNGDLVDSSYKERAVSIARKQVTGRNKIFDAAQYWGKSDQQAVIRGMVKEYKKVFGELDPLLAKDINLTPDMLKKAHKKGREEFAIASVSTIGQEAISHSAGAAVTEVSVHFQDNLLNQSQLELWAAAGISYPILAGAIIYNGFLNRELLNTGLSTDLYSRMQYINALGTGMEDIEGLKAYGKLHGSLEFLYFGIALWFAERYGVEAGLVCFIASNIAATGKNVAQAGVVKGFLETKKNLAESKKKRKEKNVLHKRKT